MEKQSKRELIKKCIEETAEIVRFLLEVNKRPKILEELPEEELKEYQKKSSYLSLDLYQLMQTPRQRFYLEQQEKERARLEAKRSGKQWK